MKTICFFIFFAFFGISSYAQLHFKEVHINTTFKGNEAYKKMAYALLSACKKQDLNMYTPHNKSKKTSYQELLFQLEGWTNEEFNPQNTICNTANDLNIISSLFMHRYILWYDDSNALHSPVTPTYIQFFIPANQEENYLDILGPVFSFQEIMKAKIRLEDSDQYLHELIINHHFQGYEVDEKGNHLSFHR